MARRSFATMPFLATVIADEKVAAAYHNNKFQCTITISKDKSKISNIFSYKSCFGVCQKILERRSD